MNQKNGSENREESLVDLYAALTGASESEARNVYMFVECQEGEKMESEDESEVNVDPLEAAPWLKPKPGGRDTNDWPGKTAAVPAPG
jgi:hypothetical protein